MSEMFLHGVLLMLGSSLLLGAATADPRDLPAEATFADLVRAAQAADPKTDAKAGCLLRMERDTAGRARLSAALIPPEERGPAPRELPADLSGLLSRGQDLALDTPLGRYGSRHAGVVLTSLVPVSRSLLSGLVPVLAVTARGTLFTVVAPPETFKQGPRAERLGPAEIARLQKEILPAAHGVIVTAEAGVKMAQLAKVLGLLRDFPGQVVLATARAGNEAAPGPEIIHRNASPLASDHRDASPLAMDPTCARESMDIPPGETPGYFPPRVSFSAVAAAQQETQRLCEGSLPRDGGGVFSVSLRIGKDGRVSKACFVHPSGDEATRACVLAAAQRHRFPRILGGTFLNLGFEVKLLPQGVVQHALCSP